MLILAAHHLNMSPAEANFLGWAVVIAVVAGFLAWFVHLLKGGQ